MAPEHPFLDNRNLQPDNEEKDMRVFIGKTYSLFLIRQFLKVFLVTIIFIMGLSFIVRTLQGLESTRGFSFAQIVVLRILEAPEIISRECLLASCMFASVYTMSTLTKNREILALRSCGVSIYKIISPLIIIGAIIGGSSLLFENYVVVPSFDIKGNFINRLKGEKPKGYYMDRSNIIVFGENNIIYKIDKYSAKEMAMRGVMIIKKTKEGNIEYRIDAERGKWDGDRWIFYNGIMRTFSADGEIEGSKAFKVLATSIRDDPQYFGRDTRTIENMSLGEAYRYTRMMKRMGFDYNRFLTRFHRKIANSVTYFFIVIIGLSLGSMQFKNALVISFSMTLGMVLVFFFIIEIGTTLGSSGRLSPVIGGWLGNIVFLFIGVYLLSRLRV
jgi:lipopolysaccharide export system permease protein